MKLSKYFELTFEMMNSRLGNLDFFATQRNER